MEIPGRTTDEPRWLLTGKIEAKQWSAIGTDAKRVNVGFSVWMVASLDREARRLGVPRQPLIKLWLADKLDQAVAAGKR